MNRRQAYRHTTRLSVRQRPQVCFELAGGTATPETNAVNFFARNQHRCKFPEAFDARF